MLRRQTPSTATLSADPLDPPKAVPMASPGAQPGPYRKPQSFYFSGVARSAQAPLPDAPIVTQIFNNFAQVRPDPAKTWDLVGRMCTGVIPECQLFNRSGTAPGTWGSIPPK